MKSHETNTYQRKRYKKRRKAGICVTCPNPSDKAHCYNCRVKRSQAYAHKLQLNKMRTLQS